MRMSYALGLDIGSVNAKLALVDASGKAVYFDVEKIIANPKAAVNTLLSRLSARFRLDDITSAGVSGSGKGVVPAEYGWGEYSSPLAIASGLLSRHPDVKTILQI